MHTYILIWISLLGIFIGSFINALVWRIHTNRPIFLGRSMCPKCKHRLTPYELVPLLSWLALKGKCRNCKKPISLQYPLIELLTGVLFGLFYLSYSFDSVIAYFLFVNWLLILLILITLTIYDFRWMLLPNKLLKLLLFFSLSQILVLIINGEYLYVVYSLISAVIFGGFFYAMHAYSKGKWMGGGDVKLAFIMGLLLGFSKIVVALMVAFNSAALIGGFFLLTKKYTRKSLMPFGPFLIGGTIIAELYGVNIVNWYLGLTGLNSLY
jgi:prepilin signal peptidase PulO-like enzyme (type II secretory pathway)